MITPEALFQRLLLFVCLILATTGRLIHGGFNWQLGSLSKCLSWVVADGWLHLFYLAICCFTSSSVQSQTLGSVFDMHCMWILWELKVWNN